MNPQTTDVTTTAPLPDIMHQLDIRQTVQLVKDDLKAHFPGVRFRVTMRRHAISPNITVTYENGPPKRMVQTLLDHYIRDVFHAEDDTYRYRGPDVITLPSGHRYCVSDYGVQFIHVDER